jgi:hypothetical protein
MSVIIVISKVIISKAFISIVIVLLLQLLLPLLPVLPLQVLPFFATAYVTALQPDLNTQPYQQLQLKLALLLLTLLP